MTRGSLTSRLSYFAQQHQQLIKEAKALIEMVGIDAAGAKHHVKKPVLLKMTLEKYVEMIEGTLLPNLPPGGVTQNRSNNDTNPCHRVSTPRHVEDFRSPTNPSVRIKRDANFAKTKQTSKNSQFRTAQVGESGNKIKPEESQAGKASTSSRSHSSPKDAKPAQPRVTKSKNGGRRRTTPRYACRLPLNYCVVGRDKSMHRAFSKDVGALGLFIQASRPEKAGDTIKIEVEMPGNKKAIIHAVVTWTKWVPRNLRAIDMPGFGVKITNASECWYSYFMNNKPSSAHL